MNWFMDLLYARMKPLVEARWFEVVMSVIMLLHNLARNEYVNEGSQLAGLISKEMEKSTPFVNRGVKQAAFYVLRGTYTPGVLVEMGFMTNVKDQKDLNDKKVRAKLAGAIFKGIVKYAQMKKWR